MKPWIAPYMTHPHGLSGTLGNRNPDIPSAKSTRPYPITGSTKRILRLTSIVVSPSPSPANRRPAVDRGLISRCPMTDPPIVALSTCTC